MSGCSWQERSFSVAASEGKLDCICLDCGGETPGVYKYNGDFLCKECFNKKSVKPFSLGSFNTDKDLTYNFVTEMFTGKPIQINSKRQFKSLLKQHNLADASIKECKQEVGCGRRVKS